MEPQNVDGARGAVCVGCVGVVRIPAGACCTVCLLYCQNLRSPCHFFVFPLSSSILSILSIFRNRPTATVLFNTQTQVIESLLEPYLILDLQGFVEPSLTPRSLPQRLSARTIVLGC